MNLKQSNSSYISNHAFSAGSQEEYPTPAQRESILETPLANETPDSSDNTTGGSLSELLAIDGAHGKELAGPVLGATATPAADGIHTAAAIKEALPKHVITQPDPPPPTIDLDNSMVEDPLSPSVMEAHTGPPEHASTPPPPPPPFIISDDSVSQDPPSPVEDSMEHRGLHHSILHAVPRQKQLSLALTKVRTPSKKSSCPTSTEPTQDE